MGFPARRKELVYIYISPETFSLTDIPTSFLKTTETLITFSGRYPPSL